MAKGKITKTTVDNLLPAPSGKVFLWDEKIGGFGVYVTPTGDQIAPPAERAAGDCLAPGYRGDNPGKYNALRLWRQLGIGGEGGFDKSSGRLSNDEERMRRSSLAGYALDEGYRHPMIQAADGQVSRAAPAG